MASEREDVYCTLVLSDSYLPGAAVLAHSLRDFGTKKKLAVLVTADCLRASTITELKSLYDYVIPVQRIGNPNPSNLYLMNRGDLLYAFTKINLWRQMQFRKIVYLDADVVALRAPDELFDLSASFAGAPDVGWPDAFNTGVMVLTPHMGDYWALKTLAQTGDSFDGADQGLLNQYFEHKDWHRLSFTYNCTPSANYQYEPAYRYHKSRISLVHFIGKTKPWNANRSNAATPGAYNELLYRWWAVYDRHFRESASDYASGRYTPASTAMAQPEASVISTEPDPAEPRELAEELGQGLIEPTPTAEQRKFSAPMLEWDATRAAPPVGSKPEAANFPSKLYEFNKGKDLFRAPSYPSPPKDMYYKVPETTPNPPTAKLAPIFPWEERQAARPTRKFADEIVSPESTPQPPSAATDQSTPITPTIKVTSDDPWQYFETGTKNAWDEDPGITNYIRGVAATLRKNSVIQPSPMNKTSFERRESLVLTDFPTAIERPSLPVTPAPIRRVNFWAGERNNGGQLPSAEGVPNQIDWNPSEKLEELRRSSVNMPLDLKMPEKTLPKREMPSTAPAPSGPGPVASSSSTPASDTSYTSQSSVSSVSSASTITPQFTNPSFTNSSLGNKDEEVLSPTEHGTRQF